MFSVVVPVYNEAAGLRPCILALTSALEKLGNVYEIIIAEDGSTDGTLRIAESLAAKSRKIRIISSKTRQGRGASLNRAIGMAKGRIVIYTDCDLAADLAYLKPLVAEIEHGADIATGSRLLPNSKTEARGVLRDLLSRGYNSLLRLLFRTSLHDHQCGFKAFRKSSVLPLLKEVKDKHWFWDSELLIRAQVKGLKVSEIPVKWKGRKGSSVVLSRDVLYMGLAALFLRARILVR